MKLNITVPAQKRIMNLLEKQDGKLSLYYNENFQGTYACSITGIFELKISNDIENSDKELDSPLGPIYVDPDKIKHLDKENTIDYKEDMNILQLKGNSGLLVDNLKVVTE